MSCPLGCRRRLGFRLRHARRRTAFRFTAFAFTLLLGVLLEQFGVLVLKDALLLGATLLHRDRVSFTLDTSRRDQALNLRCFDARLLALLGQRTFDHVLAHVVLFAQVEQLANVIGTFGSETTWNRLVGQTFDFLFAAFGDHAGDDGEIGIDDAAANGLTLAFTFSSLTVALVAFVEQETNTLIGQHTLHHGEALLVVSTGDAQLVALPFVAQTIGIDFLSDAFLHEGAQFTVIVDVEQFLTTGDRIGNVEFHGVNLKWSERERGDRSCIPKTKKMVKTQVEENNMLINCETNQKFP